jgi:hypothetical protein
MTETPSIDTALQLLRDAIRAELEDAADTEPSYDVVHGDTEVVLTLLDEDDVEDDQPVMIELIQGDADNAAYLSLDEARAYHAALGAIIRTASLR